jgi:hypothetical protein
MHRPDVVAWVLNIAGDLRLSQAKTLAELVAAAVDVGRATLSAIGPQVTGPAAAKHRIKRVWRFCANRRVEVSGGMAGVIDRLTRVIDRLTRRRQMSLARAAGRVSRRSQPVPIRSRSDKTW